MTYEDDVDDDDDDVCGVTFDLQVEVDDCHTLLIGTASAHDSDVGLLDGDGDETLTSPPDSPWERRG